MLRAARIAAACLLATGFAQAADRVVDFRYGIPTWHQPLGVPEDWHKPMANERGALLYDFGPGPYVQGLTVVEAAAEGEAFTHDHQLFLEGPRVPIMSTVLKRGSDSIHVTTLAIAPEKASPSDARTKDYERLDGISGAIDWAKPATGVSPEFRNVAWGITRPIHYRVKVGSGAAKRIMLGFCESYKNYLYQRTAHMQVEGAPDQIVDLALNAPHNQAQLFLFDGRDADSDGWINIKVFAPQGQDPNATLATLAVYAAGTTLTRAELLSGSLAEKDRAELRIACGTEVLRQQSRTDLINAKYSGNAQPELAVKSLRTLVLAKDGTITEDNRPFLLTQPQATALTRTDKGWKVSFPAGTKEITAWVLSGKSDDGDARKARKLSVTDAVKQTTARWNSYAIPYDRVTVADPAIQSMIVSSLRTLYQARETIAGQTQFNSSFSLYRGLWAGDAVYITNLVAHLGDSKSGRQTLDALFSHQLPNGIIDELHPQQIYRTTAEVIWGVERDAQISNNWDYAKEKWQQIVLGVAGIRGLRDQTLKFPDAPYYGMFPPGFSDGGILDIGAEYSSVYCAITGLHAAERIAARLGHAKEAAEFRQLADEFHAAFEKNRKRDQRRDKNGNLYLPVRVGFKGEDPIPQLTQWAFMDSHLNGEGWLTSDHEIVQGSLALLESTEKQGIPVSLGWMPNGIWAGMGMMYAFQPLILNRPEKVSDILYAAANHASRVGTWVEEQSLVGDPLKLAGDQPHNFAATMMVHLPASMLAYDRVNTVHLLGAVPQEWLKANSVNRLDKYRTGAGTVTLALTVSADGKTATLNVEPITRSDKPIKIMLHTASLKNAGFTVSNKDESIELQPGQRFKQTYTRK
ncbi:hypothetical protein [Oleiharenicola lentus]|uniref:hypothetical protein n=1 Tax=Oleiharenicola lentus TaxID=2508720 RepID=UPI003F669AFC